MLPIPQGALSQITQGSQGLGQANGQTVFRAQVHVDKEKQKQITKRNQSQVDNNLFELIKELHNQHGNPKQTNVVQGMSLDPAMVDKFNSRNNGNQTTKAKDASRANRFAETA